MPPSEMKLIDRLHLKWLMWATRKTKGNTTHTAKLLGISVRTVRNWRRYFGVGGRIKEPTKRMMDATDSQNS